ncbi:TBP-associated factor 12 isoform X2 [Tasmannia lanceolata]|uniref:TBP-associated factor 12 isoform X2 n=1 Tax=Tasmannia lanceolata TaxID=3420 RepID=UPI004063520C
MDSTETTPQPAESIQTPTPPPSSSNPEIPTSSSPSPNPNPNPNQNPQPTIPLQHHTFQQSQQKPPLIRNRPQPPYPHFSHLASLPSSSSSSPSSSASSRGGVALGVPAHHGRPQQQPGSFSNFGSSSFNQQFSGLARSSVNMPDQISNSNTTQMRPSGVPGHQQQRPVQPPLRSQPSSNNQSLSTQKFQGHGMLRVPSMGSPNSPSPNTPQGSQSHQQPWMSTQGKQMHPSSLSSSPSYRPQLKSQSLQQRSHYTQQYPHPSPMTTQQQQMASVHQQQQQPQSSQSHQTQENYGQQYPPTRVQQPFPHQPQATRTPLSASQKSLALAAVQPGMVQSGPLIPVGSIDVAEGGNKILSKRSIQELVTQIDPSERLDPEVEDVLAEIADDFVESITTVACSLAKHRKSTTLEAKDILLHLERNWSVTLPGFGGDEIKNYKKLLANDIHKERLTAIKKSIVGVEAGNTKSSGGQAVGNAKGHMTKAPVIGSPK